jgi:hypothetical protein
MLRKVRARSELIATTSIALALVVLAALIFFVLPPLLITSGDVPDAAERLRLENDVRTTGVQLLAGAVLALGAFFTARTIRVNREGQITERFTRAIDHLGNGELDIRLGGIYALERIARDSRRDHEPIMEVLVTFVQHHARAVARPGGLSVDRRTPKRSRRAPARESFRQPADVQAAISVLGRRNTDHETEPLVIPFSDVDLRGADLGGACLEQALFADVRLEDTSFFDADLRDAVFIDVELEDAVFVEADLRGAKFIDSNLRRSSFWNADLESVYFDNVDLRETDFDGANLHGTNVAGVRLRGARYDSATRWPDGLDPVTAGAVRSEAAEDG